MSQWYNESLCLPHSSTTCATNLQHLSPEYCDSITDTDMEDIVTVCRGSLTVIYYYSLAVKPRILRLNKFKIKCHTNQNYNYDVIVLWPHSWCFKEVFDFNMIKKKTCFYTCTPHLECQIEVSHTLQGSN